MQQNTGKNSHKKASPFQGKGGANAKVSKSVVVGNKGKKHPNPVVEDVDTVNMSVTI